MPGGVAPPAQLLADLSRGQAKGGVQRVEEAGLTHPGVASKSGDLSRQQTAQLVDSQASNRADRKGGDSRGPIGLQQLLGRDQVPLVDAQNRLAALALGQRDDPIQQKRIAHRDRPGGDDDQLVQIGHRRTLKGIAAGQNLHQGARPIRLEGNGYRSPPESL